jgi:hypothetical protein
VCHVDVIVDSSPVHRSLGRWFIAALHPSPSIRTGAPRVYTTMDKPVHLIRKWAKRPDEGFVAQLRLRAMPSANAALTARIRSSA